MNLYHVLGVSSSASDSEIKAAWRILILKYHPDKHSSDNNSVSGPLSTAIGQSRSSSSSSPKETREERLHSITQAYELLRDPIKREGYDRELRDAARLGSKGGSASHMPKAPPPLARTTISLELFEPHFNASVSTNLAQAATPGSHQSEEGMEEHDEEELAEEEPDSYTYPCRCGREFVITREDLEEGVDVIGCDGCGDYIGVGYEVVEDADED